MDYASWLNWKCLRIPKEELDKVAREREIWVYLPDLGKAVEDGLMEKGELDREAPCQFICLPVGIGKHVP